MDVLIGSKGLEIGSCLFDDCCTNSSVSMRLSQLSGNRVNERTTVLRSDEFPYAQSTPPDQTWNIAF